MTQWEYLDIDFQSNVYNRNYGEFRQYYFVSFIEPERLGLDPDRKMQPMGEVLDILGSNRWELVMLYPIVDEENKLIKQTKYIKAVLKRPVID